MRTTKIGIVLPTYREESNIPSLLEAICQNVPDATVLVVDDSPDDKTADAARQTAATLGSKGIKTDVRVLKRRGARGRMSAVRAGFAAMYDEGCDYIIEMDTDGSHPPSQLPQLISEALEGQADILICSRDLPASRIDGWPWRRHVLHFLATRSCRVLLRLGIKDYMNAYRIYSRRAVDVMLRESGKISIGFWGFGETLVHVVARKGKVGEIPTHFVNRTKGQSQVKPRVILGCMVELLQVFLLRLTIDPSLEFGESRPDSPRGV